MNAVYAFDSYFDAAQPPIPIPGQWDLLRQLGYDKIQVSIGARTPQQWERLRAVRLQRARTGVSLAAAYTVVDLRAWRRDRAELLHAIEDIMRCLDPGDTLELALMAGWKEACSDESLDAEVVRLLEPILALARKHALTLALYNHYGFWLERIEDSLRLCQRCNDPALKMSFNAYHWFACEGREPEATVELTAPWLHRVGLCGSRRTASLFAGVLPATIERVGEGDFPLQELLRALRTVHFTGDIGFLGYGLAGVPEENLRVSLNNFRAAVKTAAPIPLS